MIAQNGNPTIVFTHFAPGEQNDKTSVTMARVTLLLGGNEGDVKRTQAAQQLVNARVGAVLRCSHRYESEPWGFASAARFSNQALEITTDLSPLEARRRALHRMRIRVQTVR